MSRPQRIAVIDIGKTNAKVVLFDAAEGRETLQHSRRNQSIPAPYRHFDTAALWRFICESLADIAGKSSIDAISITTHGACFALVDANGGLAMPVMDYEDTAPDDLDEDYRRIRPPFSETGSPRLPMGLNAAAMLYWQSRANREAFARTRHILPWPQYWAFRLTGVIASEATSLGVHTDLWNPHEGRFSSLVTRLGWERLMPEIRPANAVLGPVRADLAAELGLPADIPVYSGIHDSNASLLPHLYQRRAPFSVLSTGTWVVTLSVGGRDVVLDERRDSLLNVNALGEKTPSARFMGGRAFEILAPQSPLAITDADRKRVLDGGIMFLPSLPAGSGPFPHSQGRWTMEPEGDGERLYAVSLYLALMAGVTLDLVGAEGDVIVEGPFAANPDFIAMLATLRGRKPIVSEGRTTGTSYGAACLALGPSALRAAEAPASPATPDPRLSVYAERWRALAGA